MIFFYSASSSEKLTFRQRRGQTGYQKVFFLENQSTRVDDVTRPEMNTIRGK